MLRSTTGWILGLLLAGTPMTGEGGPDGRGGGDPGPGGCGACHQFPARLSHPVGIRPHREVALPLDAGGNLTCTTCHAKDARHQWGKETAAGAGLRLPVRELCRQCHPGEHDPSSRLGHAIAIGKAHVAGSGVRLASIGIDTESRACLGCHDGSAARGWSRQDHGGGPGSSSHPIGRAYDEHSRQGRLSSLRPRRHLPAEIRLPGGTVGCTSCHSPFSGEDMMLTVTNRESLLCRSCHAK